MSLAVRRLHPLRSHAAAGPAAFVLSLLLAVGLAGPGEAAQKQPKPMPFGTARADSNLPIDVTADRLEVDQNSEVATFSGNVRVVQGNVTLRTQTLKVYYDKDRPRSGAAVQKLEASGGVLFQAPGETAKGDRATYDVVSRVANLTGDVVLTRQESVLRGEHLTIDFQAGQTHMEGGAGSSPGRVHGTFVPENRNKEPGKAGGGR